MGKKRQRRQSLTKKFFFFFNGGYPGGYLAATKGNIELLLAYMIQGCP